MPKVSVQIPCYNSERYLSKTIESVLGQTFGDFEIVIINDGSSDTTENIAKNYRDTRIKYIYQNNRGLAAARNRALSESTGEYIAFLDHDDLWLPEKLEKQIGALEANKDTAIAYSNFYRIFPDGKKTIRFRADQPEGDVFERFLYSYPLGLLTAVVRRSALDGLSARFDENLKIFEDYDIFMRILQSHKAAYLHEPLAVYRIHDSRSTIRFADQYADEYKYVIDKLKGSDPSFVRRYHRALGYVDAVIAHIRAKAAMAGRDPEKARNFMRAYRLSGCRFFLLYALTFFPPICWDKVHQIKNDNIFL